MTSRHAGPDDLLKDARFLEHVAISLERNADHASNPQEEKRNQHRPFKTRRQQDLIKVIRRDYEGTRITFLPSNFSRAQQNRSHASIKNHMINWTVEVNQDGGTRLLHSVPDTMSVGELCDCISHHHNVFVHDDFPGVRRPSWIALPNSSTMSIKDALRNVGVVEFPRFKFCRCNDSDVDEQ